MEIPIEDPKDNNDVINNYEKMLNDIDNEGDDFDEPEKLSKKERLELKKKKKILKPIQKKYLKKEPPTDIQNKVIFKQSIIEYKLYFPNYMTAYIDRMNNEYLDTLSLDELAQFLQEIRSTLAVIRPKGNLYSSAYFTATQIIESAVIPVMAEKMELDLDASGWTEALQQNEEVNETLNMIYLQNNLIYVPPELKLLTSTLSSLSLVINNNKFNKSQKNIPKKDDFKDL
jgi:hypothetical protein